MNRAGPSIWWLGLLLLVAGLWWWGGGKLRMPGGPAPVIVAPRTLVPRSGRFVQLPDPQLGLPARHGELEQALDSCLAEQPDFLIVTGNATAGPEHRALFLAHLARLEQQGVQAFWLPGRQDLPEEGGPPSAFSLRLLHYGGLDLIGLPSTLFLADLGQEDAYVERVFVRSLRALRSGTTNAALVFHPTSLLDSGWDAKLRERWLAAPEVAASLLCLDGARADSLCYRLQAGAYLPAPAGLPGMLLSAGSQAAPRTVWRLFLLDEDGGGIAFEERAADGRLLRQREHLEFP